MKQGSLENLKVNRRPLQDFDGDLNVLIFSDATFVDPRKLSKASLSVMDFYFYKSLQRVIAKEFIQIEPLRDIEEVSEPSQSHISQKSL